MEIWKAVENTNNMIEISNFGRVKSNLSGNGRILQTQKDSKGYLRVSVTIERVKHTYKVHRLVACAFVLNPKNLPQVNHKDGNKLNNSSENLEWCTNKENAYHAIKSGLWKNVFEASRKNNNKRKTPIIATKINTSEIVLFDSISDAEKSLGTRHITDVLKGKRKQAKGYTFALGGDDNVCNSRMATATKANSIYGTPGV